MVWEDETIESGSIGTSRMDDSDSMNRNATEIGTIMFYLIILQHLLVDMIILDKSTEKNKFNIIIC